MAQFAATTTVGTSAGDVDLPTDGGTLRIINIGSNTVWVSVKTGVTAAVGADECVPIPAGTDYIVQPPKTLSAIADGGSSDITVEVRQGR